MSVEARNSRVLLVGRRVAPNVQPFGVSFRRCTHRLTGSQVKALPRTPRRAGRRGRCPGRTRRSTVFGGPESWKRCWSVLSGKRRFGFGSAGTTADAAGRRGRTGSASGSGRRADSGGSACCCRSRTSCPSRRGPGPAACRPVAGSSSPVSGLMRKSRLPRLVRLAVEALDRPAEQAARAVDPAVEAVFQAVHAGLVVVGAEAAEEFLHHVGLAVAVGVLGVEDVRGGADRARPSARPSRRSGTGCCRGTSVALSILAVVVAGRSRKRTRPPGCNLPRLALRVVDHLGRPTACRRARSRWRPATSTSGSAATSSTARFGFGADRGQRLLRRQRQRALHFVRDRTAAGTSCRAGP